MTLADLEAAFEDAKKVYREDKTNKKNKKKFKKAKQALAEAKEAGGTPSKKRSAEEATEQTPKKKAKKGPSLDELRDSAIKAKKAFKADKSNKDNKTAWKAAKQALAEAETNPAGVQEEAVDIDALKAAVAETKKTFKADKKNKEAKAAFKAAKAALAEAETNTADVQEEAVDIDALKAAVVETKKTFKADKKNKEAKAAFKAAKAALAEAEAGESETKEDSSVPDVLASLKKKEPEPEVNNFLSGLKKAAPPPEVKHNHDENPPSERLFVGNLSFDIDDDAIKKFFVECGELTDIYWMMDRETERFKGFGFITFESLEASAKAMVMNGQELMGRPMRISYSKPRANRGGGGGGGGGRGGAKGGARPLSEKPDGCTSVFVGNLSYDVDEAKIGEFLKDCGGLRAVRWLKDRESGEFKGAGFVEFDDPSTGVDVAVKLNGKEFLGRTVRIDYAKPRPPREY